MPPSPVVVDVPTSLAPRPSASLAGPGQRAERHAGDGDRDIKVQRMFGVPIAEDDVGVAALAVALQRVARHRRAEEEQVVEVRKGPFGAPAADVVDTGFGRAMDGRDRLTVEGGGLAQAEAGPVVGGVAHQ